MKFFLDENVPPLVADAVRSIYIKHNWVSAHDNNRSTYRGIDDTDLFRLLAKDKFDAIITHDKNQLTNHEERSGLVEAGLHWIGFSSSGLAGQSGLPGIALRSATLLAGLHCVLDDWRTEPHRYHLKGIPAQPGQRMTVSPLRHADRTP